MKLKLGSSYHLTLRRMVYMLISNVSTWTLKLSFFNRFFIFFTLFLLVYFVYSLFLIKIVLFRFKKLSFIIKILNLVGRSNIWVRCCLNQGYSRILVKSLSKRGSPIVSDSISDAVTSPYERDCKERQLCRWSHWTWQIDCVVFIPSTNTYCS